MRPLVAAALGVLPVTPHAEASPNVVVLVGTGTIYWGLPTTGCWSNQMVTFDGRALFAGTHIGDHTVHFEGSSSICESLNAGAGSGTLSGAFTGVISYNRTSTAVLLIGDFRIHDGPLHSIVWSLCQFQPTSFNPVQTYALECTLLVQ